MKNYLVLAMLAVFTWTAPLSAVRPEYGFFSTIEQQVIPGPTSDECEKSAVSFDDEGEHSRHIYLLDEDSSAILLERPGVYLVQFIVAGRRADVTDLIDEVDVQNCFRFAVTLNDEVIPGSVYATDSNVVEGTENGIEGHQTVVGQIVFVSENSDAVLKLVNDGDCDADVTLISDTGCCDPASTSASIYVQRLYKRSQN